MATKVAVSHGASNSSTPKQGGTPAGQPRSSNPTQGESTTPSTSKPKTPKPGDVINLTNWKLTLPIGDSNSKKPYEITQPTLASYALAPYFQVASSQDGILFQAPVGGVTTSNSNFPRSELREMTNNGADNASWTNVGTSSNTMTIREAIMHLPAKRPQLVAGQIHDASEYIILIRLNGSVLFVQANGDNIGTLDGSYTLGTPFTVTITATNGHIYVTYNSVQKVDYAKSGTGYYFKAGCYTQSNTTYGDDPNDYGQVVIYSLSVQHTLR